MEQGMLNNQQREQMQGIAALGRNEDTYLAHVAPDEMIVPAQALRDNPLLKVAIEKSISNYGIDPNQFLVGNGSMDLNPLTGLPEFGFLSKVWKKAKGIVKKVAPIAAMIPGPWQPFAAVYVKANALNNIAKGDGGIGDLLTLGAGGSQKIFGDKGALKNISSGSFKTMGGGFGSALKNIGQVDKLDKLGNVVQGETVFNPFRYGAELGKTYGENQRQGYGGIFKNVGGADTLGGQTFNAVTSTGNPAGGIMNAVGGPQGQMMMASGQQPAGGNDDFLNYTKENFVEGGQRQRPDGQIEALHKDGTYYTMDEAQQYYNVLKETNQLSQPIQQGDGRGTSGQSVIGMIEDMIKGKTSNAPDHFIGVPGMNNVRRAISKNIPEFKNRAGESGSPFLPESAKNIFSNNPNNSGGMFGGNAGLMGLSALAGKIAYDSAKERMGGLAETPKVTMDQLGRYEMAQNLGTGGSRADFGLAPAPLALDFAYGGEARQYFNQGGLATMIDELDMREGGESEGPGTGTSDDIPAMLSDGEFVMTAKATRGAGAFDVNKTKSGIELIKGGSASREKGVKNMRELMNIFEAI
jgi:hypothetical protein